MMTPMSATPRPVALVTAPFRGEGLETLRDLADVVLDPWISADTMRMYNAEQLAERARKESATIVICESDVCAGPVMELPLIAIGSTRGDPTNVDVPAATAAGIPVLRAPGRNADAVAELAVALLFSVTRHVVSADHDVRAGEVLHIPSLVQHKAEALEDTLDVDVFSPPRQDWLDKTDEYLRQK